ncbi:polysaccharide pyruvyl transferase family protein [Neorhizobium sp. P12A]|uniref:polysaccharide pyruvyl transferase family protein n=1 Tax=Neorhizobium sp. P12A TaxID=2268027 RepID=UPI00165E6311|nr:polysaccharide pyruvyl transferase family protein [Neorhizobium sp. P12A]
MTDNPGLASVSNLPSVTGRKEDTWAVQTDIAGLRYARGTDEPPRLRLLNVKYSPNLGDGLIAECLERAAIALGAGNDTWSVDLAGRKRYGEASAGRAQILLALDRMPKTLRHRIIRPLLAAQARRKWRPHYADGLKGATGAAIGGGNLISDLDLNFPTKLTFAVAELERLSLPFVIYATGVTLGWTSQGTSMLREAFSSSLLRKVFMRDHQSKVLWDQRFGESLGIEARIVRDPGLLASDFFPRSSQSSERRSPVAGIGVTSHLAIRYHTNSAPDPAYLRDWYIELVRSFVSKGFQTVVFTNGSPEDVSYLEQLRPYLAAAGGAAVTFQQPRTPKELCAVISGLDVLIAHRLHAIIAAYSYGVPALGLSWDRKLRFFLMSVSRENWLCDLEKTTAQSAVELACRTAAEGICEKRRKQVLWETWEGVSQLLEAVAGPSSHAKQFEWGREDVETSAMHS